MRIAFYAPLKAPDHPVPSGDRRMARSLMALLERLGHEVRLVSRLRSYDRDGDALRQMRLRTLATRMADRLARRLHRDGAPDLWITYHCYHKAPDWLGPVATRQLGIPYLIVEPSLAGKQADGPWAVGHAGTRLALAQADLLLAMTGDDLDGLGTATGPPAKMRLFPPFLDATPFAAAARCRAEHRARLAAEHGLDPERPWLLSVAMMRSDVKRDSYLALADALGRLRELPWQLVCVGDGPARAEVEARMAGLGSDRVRCVGARPEAQLPAFYVAADLMVWPAFREAYGLALLEAQAAGLPVVACREGGVADVVADGETGLLVADRDLAAFADAIAGLLRDPQRRGGLARAARVRVAARHDLPAAARRLELALADAVRINRQRLRRAA
ncbi:MAG TPA: glycosyltransferase family 4 protein [Geminicoccaceae bacterium]|nr:glycosyltransferase family 4 protein [Geminicoccus sp.]HMU52775.1 glycosyltransferase family 4 protein [Geminicoccaceae bacterium]